MPREPLSAIDAAWLRMDDATNAMTVSTLLVFDEPMDRARFVALVKERVLRHRRFRQRVVVPRWPFAKAHWQDVDETFRVEDHVESLRLPAPGDDAAMQRAIGPLLGTPLDRDRPLWKAHVLEGCGRGGAVLVRIHHCVGDGVALVHMLLSIVDEGVVLPPVDVGLVPPRPTRPLEIAREAWTRAKTFVRLTLAPNDAPSTLRGALAGRKGGAWSSAVSLEDVRRAAHRRGATVNDLLMAAIAGAIDAHLRAHEDRPSRRQTHAMVPVYLQGGPAEGNHFGLVFLALPGGVVDPEERLRLVKARMDAIKSSREAVVALETLAFIGAMPRSIERLAIAIFTRKASLMVTDVPGPPAPIHLDGARVRSMVLWPPVAGRLGVAMGLLSHAGEVRLGVAVDVRRVADPYALVARFERELDALGVRSTAERAIDSRAARAAR